VAVKMQDHSTVH